MVAHILNYSGKEKSRKKRKGTTGGIEMKEFLEIVSEEMKQAFEKPVIRQNMER